MEDIQPCLKDGVIVEQELWFFENDIQAFCRMDKKTFEMEIVTPYISNHLFMAMWIFHWKDCLYAVSMNPTEILIFNINTFVIEKVQNDKVAYERTIRLSDAFQQDNKIWLIPCYAKSKLWYFDMNKNQYEKDIFFSNYISKSSEENKMLICRSSLWKQELWSVVYKCAYLLRYDARRQEIVKLSFPEIHGTLDGILYSKGCIWLTVEENANIYRIRDQKLTEIVVSGMHSYSNLRETERFVIALPRFGNIVVMVDKEILRVHIVELQENKIETKGSSKIINVCEDEHYIILFPNALDNVEIIDKALIQMKIVQIKCDDLYQRIKRIGKFRWGNIGAESAEIPLKDYLNYILWKQNKNSENGRMHAIGREIYKNI